MSFVNYSLLGVNCSIDKNVLVSSRKYFSPHNPMYIPSPQEYDWIPYPNVDNLPSQEHNRKLPSKCQHCFKYSGLMVPLRDSGCSSCSMRG